MGFVYKYLKGSHKHMRNKIVKVFIEKKRKPIVAINNTINIDPMQKGDDINCHLLQKPIQSGYTNNQP